jgi:hypothetical protein
MATVRILKGMKVFVKNMPRLHLLYLLQRRKTTLTDFIAESGITTYDDLIGRCERLGVVPPTVDEFSAIKPQHPSERVNSPQEGIVVIEPIERAKRQKKQKKDENVPGHVAEHKDDTGRHDSRWENEGGTSHDVTIEPDHN